MAVSRFEILTRENPVLGEAHQSENWGRIVALRRKRRRGVEIQRLLRKLMPAALAVFSVALAGQAFAADNIRGQVLGGGAPIAQSTVTLWAASAGAPRQLAQTKTDNEGRFELRSAGAPAESSLYLVATRWRA